MSESLTSLDKVIAEIVKQSVKEAIFEAMKQPNEDRLLNAQEAANLLSISEDWLYRNGKKLPFTRKLGSKMLRFSSLGIQKYLASRKTA